MADCIVVGAGLIGMLTAYELSREGLQVTIVEKGQPARESTWAGGGILSPLYPWRYPDAVSELARWSQHLYPTLCDELKQQSGVDPQYIRSGLLIAGDEERDLASDWSSQFDANLQFVDAEQIRDLEPAIVDSTKTAIWLEDIAQVRNPRFAKALTGALIALGVNFKTDCEVIDWVTDGGRVQAVKTVQGDLVADHYVICSGAWTGKLLASTGLNLPVEPVRGQMILYKGELGMVSRIILKDGRYIIPRADGRILVGSTLEYTGFDKQTTSAALRALQESACALMPALCSLSVEHHWAGLRPGSPDGTPMIGVHPQLENLYINAGHFRNGVVLGPASVRILVDTLLGRDFELDAHPYRPENFHDTPINRIIDE